MSGNGRTPALEAKSISFAYRSPVIRDVTVELMPATVTGLIGPNGSGKTTCLRLLSGVLRPSGGTILLDGNRPLSELSRREAARQIAVVPQNGGDGSSLTVLEFALQGRAPHLPLFGFEGEKDVAIALAALESTQLEGRADGPAGELSGGERQRLLLARALAQEPKILLLDEITANLDINFQVGLMRLVRRLTRERGLATLVVSHEIYLLAAFADVALLMSGGAISHRGPVPEVITRENLNRLFKLDFRVRPLPGGRSEIQPLIDEWSRE